MKSASKILFAALFAIVVGTAASARAEVVYQYPEQFAIQARQIHATHHLNCASQEQVAEETKLDVVVNFATASDKLSKKDLAKVAKAAAAIKASGKVAHVLVEGHTDVKGKAAKNQDLSYRRALRVAHVLTSKFGIPADVVLAKGFGEIGRAHV